MWRRSNVCGFIAVLALMIGAGFSPAVASGSGPDLSIIMSALTAGRVLEGDEVEYQVKVTNNGPGEAFYESVFSDMPPGLTALSVSSSDCSVQSGDGPDSVQCTIFSLAEGADFDFSFTAEVQVGATGTIVTVVEVFDFPDTDNNDIASASITVGEPTSNEQDIFDGLLDACGNSGTEELDAACAVITNLEGSELADALDQISPEKAGGQANTLIETSSGQVGRVRQRLTALRAGASGVSVSGMSFDIQGHRLSMAGLENALPAGSDGGSSIHDTQRLGVFINGRAEFGEKDATANESGFEFDTAGLTVGADYRINDRVVLGGAFGIVDTSSDFDGNRGDTESDVVDLSFYGNFYPTPTSYLDWVIGFGSADFTTTRVIAVPGFNATAIGETDGEQLSASVSYGFDVNRGGWTISPYLRADSVNLDIDGYTESGGAGVALIVADQTVKSLRGVLATRVTRVVSKGWGVLVPGLRVEIEHEFDDDSRLITSNFVDAPDAAAFSIATDPADEDFFNIGLNLAATFKNGKSAFLDYETVAGQDNVDRHTITGGFRMSF